MLLEDGLRYDIFATYLYLRLSAVDGNRPTSYILALTLWDVNNDKCDVLLVYRCLDTV